MRDKPSATAGWVAACRTFGRKLPPAARLADDPYGAALAGKSAALFAKAVPALAALPLWPIVIYMQVRTRTIDDALRRFVEEGGAQIVLLGAGYDARAARFAGELAGARVFEVDHPATQARKRRVLTRVHAPSADVRYLAWDFEARPMREMPDALEALGLDRSRPTLTIWEGVTMYLSEEAIAASVDAVRAWSAPRSPFVVTYFERGRIERPKHVRAFVAKAVARRGEPFRFGWSPEALPGWFAARDFALEQDRTMDDLARALLPKAYAQLVGEAQSRIAILRRA